MSERQARRPPVAPKPLFIQQHDVGTVKISPASSPALRGATTAFGLPPARSSHSTSSHNPSAGALLAATLAASNKKPQPKPAVQQYQPTPRQPSRQDVAPVQHQPPRPAPSPRGRAAATSAKLPSPTVSDDTSLSPPTPGFRPHDPRSTSAVAAVAASAIASARTSPARKPELETKRSTLYQGRPLSPGGLRPRSPSMSSSSEDPQSHPQSLSKSPDALAGAIASMNSAPVQQVQGTTENRPKNDWGHIPQLMLQSSQTSVASSPRVSDATAAAAATTNAANTRARERTQSLSRQDAPSPSPNPSTSARPYTGSTWPRIRVTPPETDSETDSIRYNPSEGAARKPLPAPTPLRPSQAAVVAQEQANAASQTPPILDSRSRLTASSLADAIVASSLAAQHTASRAASPAPSDARPTAPRRRSRSVGSVFDGKRTLAYLPGFNKTEAPSQAPKPPQPPPRRVPPMRQTLRNQVSDNEGHVDTEPNKRGRKHWRRHPNMHHEGDRERWRDKVTERERKRYEGVWAANRGLLLDLDPDLRVAEYTRDGTPVSDLVANVVVQDVWERSRLPKDVLEEVWDLVARPGARALNREEFVVGLWLIDQRLKGRKLPVKVSPSIWSSVRHPQGVRISNKLHK